MRSDELASSGVEQVRGIDLISKSVSGMIGHAASAEESASAREEMAAQARLSALLPRNWRPSSPASPIDNRGSGPRIVKARFGDAADASECAPGR